MNNNEQKEFNFDEFNELVRKIKSGSPVHKINFNVMSPNAVAGMYLVTMRDVKSYIDNIVDRSDINDDTLLVFESRHVIECCQIIYGCLYIFNNLNILNHTNETIINNILKALLIKPIFYSSLKIEIDNIIINALLSNIKDLSKEASDILDGFKYIMHNIWFIPYAKMDDIAKEAIDNFKNDKENGDNNE